MIFTYQVLVDMPGPETRSLTLDVTAEDSTHALAAAYDTGLALVRDQWPRAISVSVVECIRVEG